MHANFVHFGGFWRQDPVLYTVLTSCLVSNLIWFLCILDVSLSKNVTPPKQTAKKKVYFYSPCDSNITRKSEHCGFVCFPSTITIFYFNYFALMDSSAFCINLVPKVLLRSLPWSEHKGQKGGKDTVRDNSETLMCQISQR